MAGHTNRAVNKQNVKRCEYPLKDDSPCQAGQRLNGRCEHHACIELGIQHGWTVSGSRKAQRYTAERGPQKLFADSSRGLFYLIQAKSPFGDRAA